MNTKHNSHALSQIINVAASIYHYATNKRNVSPNQMTKCDVLWPIRIQEDLQRVTDLIATHQPRLR